MPKNDVQTAAMLQDDIIKSIPKFQRLAEQRPI